MSTWVRYTSYGQWHFRELEESTRLVCGISIGDPRSRPLSPEEQRDRPTENICSKCAERTPLWSWVRYTRHGKWHFRESDECIRFVCGIRIGGPRSCQLSPDERKVRPTDDVCSKCDEAFRWVSWKFPSRSNRSSSDTRRNRDSRYAYDEPSWQPMLTDELDGEKQDDLWAEGLAPGDVRFDDADSEY